MVNLNHNPEKWLWKNSSCSRDVTRSGRKSTFKQRYRQSLALLEACYWRKRLNFKFGSNNQIWYFRIYFTKKSLWCCVEQFVHNSSEVLIPDNPQKIFKGAERENYSLQLRISAVSFIPVRLSIVSRGNGYGTRQRSLLYVFVPFFGLDCA